MSVWRRRGLRSVDGIACRIHRLPILLLDYVVGSLGWELVIGIALINANAVALRILRVLESTASTLHGEGAVPARIKVKVPGLGM